MVDHDDALIDLLNGIGYQRGLKSSSKAFLDESGIPTDSFLQALKHGFSSFSTSDKGQSSRFKGNVEMRQASSSGSRHHHSLSDSSASNSDSDVKDDDYNSNSDYEYVPSDFHPEVVVNRGKGGKLKSTKADKDGALKQKCVVQNPERGILNDGSHLPPTRVPSTYRQPTVSDDLELSYASRRMSTTSLALDDEAEVAKLGSDLKIKSLMLRITGQLQTIRVLEVQLGEAQGSLKQKCLEVAKAEGKLKQLEPKEKDRLNYTTKVRSKEDSKLLRAKIGADDNAARFKAQSDSLHAQLAEEESRRQRADERVRALKSYADKAKTQLREEESLNKELRGSVDALTAKTARLKKECKDLAVEAAAQRGLAAEKDAEARRQVGRTEKVEAALRQANNDIQVMREEARNSKADAASTNARLKAAQQELELLKEREAARRAEIRLQSLQDGELGSTFQRVSIESQGGLPLDRGRAVGRDRALVTASRISPSPDAQSRNIDNYFSRGTGRDEYATTKASTAAASSTMGGLDSEAKKEKERHAQTHPTSSSTPSRRPHYSLPSTAPLSTSASTSAPVRVAPSRRMQSKDRIVASQGRSASAKRNNDYITSSGDRASSDSEVNEKSLNTKRRSPKKENNSNKERNEVASSRLLLPTPSAAAQYFSDSELQHYEKHSTSSSARLMRSFEVPVVSRQQHQTATTTYPPRPPPLGTSEKLTEKHSLNFPETSIRKRNDVALPNCTSSLRFDDIASSSSSRDARNISAAMEPSKDGNRQSSMQDRVELLYSKNRASREVSETTAAATATATPITSDRLTSDKVSGKVTISALSRRRANEVLRSDRLQSMYERVTSSAAPSIWRDSDSSESDDSDS